MVKYFAALAMISTVAAQRTMTVYNACPFTIWYFNLALSVFFRLIFFLGLLSSPLRVDSPPRRRDGLPMSTLQSHLVSQPNGMVVFGDAATVTSRSTLGPPLASMEVATADWMRIDNNVGCYVPSGPVDLGPDCPALLIGPFNSTGFPVGCKSACLVDALNGDAANSPNCCSGQYDTPATCPPTGVTDYAYFKGNCPDAYAYAYDESIGALFPCEAALNAVYTITFCPPSE
ncbi:thaumatin family-domain-containing protein [Mycena galopus ATCC 62051]|nr:thaumatin family-domain-containing protein [Mycena galopus ATCC 62051]